MKKLLLIIIGTVLIGLISPAQGLHVDFRATAAATYATYTVDGDTTWKQGMTNQYYFDYEFTWAGLDQTDASIKIQIKNNTDGAWSDYPNTDTLLLNSAAGTAHIRDTKFGLLSDSIRANLDSGTCTAGTLKIYVNLGNKR